MSYNIGSEHAHEEDLGHKSLVTSRQAARRASTQKPAAGLFQPGAVLLL